MRRSILCPTSASVPIRRATDMDCATMGGARVSKAGRAATATTSSRRRSPLRHRRRHQGPRRPAPPSSLWRSTRRRPRPRRTTAAPTGARATGCARLASAAAALAGRAPLATRSSAAKTTATAPVVGAWKASASVRSASRAIGAKRGFALTVAGGTANAIGAVVSAMRAGQARNVESSRKEFPRPPPLSHTRHPQPPQR